MLLAIQKIGQVHSEVWLKSIKVVAGLTAVHKGIGVFKPCSLRVSKRGVYPGLDLISVVLVTPVARTHAQCTLAKTLVRPSLESEQ